MKFNKNKLINYLLSLNRYTKKLIFVLVDIQLCIISVWAAHYLRLGMFIDPFDIFFPSVSISIVIFLSVFYISGVYNQIFRYSGSFDLFRMSKIFTIYGVLYFLTIFLIEYVPRTVGIIQPILFYMLLMITRIVISNILLTSLKPKELKNNYVYLIENNDQQINDFIFKDNKIYNLIGFVTESNQLQNLKIMGFKVHALEQLQKLRDNENLSHVLIDLSYISSKRKVELFKKITRYNLKIKVINNFDNSDNFTDLDIIDLLGRAPVQPNKNLLSKNTRNKVVAVTGAGGSIGSEISRQLITQKPKTLILIENNELALYKITEEIKKEECSNYKKIAIKSILLNISDEKDLEELFKNNNIETIYHAAAYKHVPLVEENIVQAAKNNILSTKYLIDICVKYKVETFVLISSDKAVRPTNFMGATKRIAELILQRKSKNQNNTNFAIVRFGNVLGSSGSVVPLFKKQLDQGGPILITDKNMMRYFMTPLEAAQLVIQAGSLTKSSNIFVLEMGKSVRIFDLARNMVMLSGKTLKNKSNPDGEIEIKEIGLRKGEKLYEEISLNNNLEKTIHPLIMESIEFVEFKRDIDKSLEKLYICIREGNINSIISMITFLVTDYKVSDYLNKISKFKN